MRVRSFFNGLYTMIPFFPFFAVSPPPRWNPDANLKSEIELHQRERDLRVRLSDIRRLRGELMAQRNVGLQDEIAELSKEETEVQEELDRVLAERERLRANRGQKNRSVRDQMNTFFQENPQLRDALNAVRDRQRPTKEVPPPPKQREGGKVGVWVGAIVIIGVAVVGVRWAVTRRFKHKKNDDLLIPPI
jgi:hypothetical protein